MGNGVSSLSSYFNNAEVTPADLSSSHGPDASKHVEARGRSDTVSSTTSGRSGLSWKQSFTRLRQKSFSPARCRDTNASEGQSNSHVEKKGNSSPSRQPRMQSSTTLRQTVGMDSDSDDSSSIMRGRTTIPRDSSGLTPELAATSPDRRAPSRPRTASSFVHFSMPNFEHPHASGTLQRKPVTAVESHSRSPSPSQRSITTIRTTTSTTTTDIPQPPAFRKKSQRTDSGTAIDFKDVPVEERPVPFQEIMAVPTLEDRMAMYKKTREYWATADHGLSEWVDLSKTPKPLVA